MHHANLPIEIIIKRYLRPRKPEEWSPGTRAPRYPCAAVDVPKPGGSCSFASSAYNIRCAKIRKSGERKKDGSGEKAGRKEERIELEERPAEGWRRRGKEEYWCALVGRRSIPLMKYIVKLCESDGGVRKGEKVGRETRFRRGTVRKVVASRRNERKRARENEGKGGTGG